MKTEQILERLNEIFIDTLENDDIELTPETTAKDIPEWDSLSNVALLVAIEKKFKIQFNLSDVLKLKNVGELALNIQEKTS
ncbi:MAG: acyl carrier protein [Cyclobacteriaceae bacterium]|nr:acyl carrier protein [Cyclobacteriaceae bacterium]